MRQMSKSKVMAGLQCHKRLYLEVHRRELLDFSEQAQRAFAIGDEVGKAARGQHPDGTLVAHQDDLSQALAQTKQLLDTPGRITLFEPAFQHGRTLVRVDIFSRDGTSHRLVEVKSSTSVKPHYVNDVAIQAWVVEGAGYPVKTAYLAHVDTSFVYPGGGDYRGLFTAQDLTGETAPMMEKMPRLVAELLDVLRGPEPDIPVSPHCKEPYDCPFMSHCSCPTARPRLPSIQCAFSRAGASWWIHW